MHDMLTLMLFKWEDSLYMLVYALQFLGKKLLAVFAFAENLELGSALGDLLFIQYPIVSLHFTSCTHKVK